MLNSLYKKKNVNEFGGGSENKGRYENSGGGGGHREKEYESENKKMTVKNKKEPPSIKL